MKSRGDIGVQSLSSKNLGSDSSLPRLGLNLFSFWSHNLYHSLYPLLSTVDGTVIVTIFQNWLQQEALVFVVLTFIFYTTMCSREEHSWARFWPWALLYCWRLKVGWVGAVRYLPVFSIQPMASPCQQTDPSCSFLPMISKCFKEHGHLLLGIC